MSKCTHEWHELERATLNAILFQSRSIALDSPFSWEFRHWRERQFCSALTLTVGTRRMAPQKKPFEGFFNFLKIRNIRRKYKKSNFFILILEWKNSRIHFLHPFLFIKSLYTQKKFRKFQNKSKDFFWGFKISTHYLGVNNPSISVFKSFIIHKILLH